MGPDSAMSEAVKVDTPLPKGWTELWDAQSKRAYYKNNATLQVRGQLSLEGGWHMAEGLMLVCIDSVWAGDVGEAGAPQQAAGRGRVPPLRAGGARGDGALL